jgi:hypothetical protein
VKDISNPESNLLEAIRPVSEIMPLTPACLIFSEQHGEVSVRNEVGKGRQVL